MVKPQRRVKFGWIAPVAGGQESGFVPIVMQQEETLLPTVAKHFDSFWIFDHLLGFGDLDNPYLESWTTLTWLAARYPNMQIGHLVMAAAWRNPALVAKMSATLHALSGGRFVLGMGAGWRAEEYLAYGYPFPAASVRIKQLDEAVQIIYRMWVEKAPTAHGKYFHVEQAYCSPRPTPPPPVMIGGTGEKMMIPLIARLADWWSVPPISVEDYARKRNLLRRHMKATGRHPSEMVQTFSIYNAKLPTSSEESAAWRDRLQPLIDLGVTHFMLDCGNISETAPIERFADEVISPVNAAG